MLTANIPPFCKAAFSCEKRRFSHQISITGQTGVGTSSAIERLACRFEKLPMRYVSGGSIMRAMAKIRGFPSVEAFAEHNRLHPEEGNDFACDEMIRSFGLHNYVVTEGRLPHVFMPLAFKVLLVCDMDIRSSRRFGDLSHDDKTVVYMEVRRNMEKRDQDDCLRYEALYPGCLWEPADYDLVLDTAKLGRSDVADAIVSRHDDWFAGEVPLQDQLRGIIL